MAYTPRKVAADKAPKKRRAKGEGSIYQRKDGSWAAAIDLGWAGGRRNRKYVYAKVKNGPNGIVAKKEAAEKMLKAGIVPDDATVGEWLTHWVDTILPVSGKKITTVENYRMVVRLHLIPNLDRVRLQKLRPEHVRAFHKAMEDAGAAPATIAQAHAVLTSALNDAWNESRVQENIALRAKPAPARVKHYDKITAEQARAVLEAAGGGREYVRLVCALALGMRQGEALGLRWENVTDTHVIIEEQVRRIGGRTVRLDLKTTSSHRAIPLPDDIADAFASLRLVSGGQGYVFSNDDGETPWSAGADRDRWKRALERAGVPYIPMHGARGSAASAMVDAGVRDQAIAEALGHAKTSTTKESYTVIRERFIREAIGAAWAQVRPALPATTESGRREF